MNTLVIAPNWVGDLIMSEPLIRALAEEGPVDVLVPEGMACLAERMSGVRSVLPTQFLHGALEPKARWRWGRKLAGRYRRAYVLPNSWKSALVPAFARIPTRIGYRGEARWGLLNDIRALHQDALPRLVDRYFALARSGPAPAPTLRAQESLTLQSRFRAKANPRTLVLCPGAEYGPAKQWPLDHFATLARTKLAQGWAVWVLGGPRDQRAGQRLAQDAPGLRSFAGETTLAQALDLIAAASVLVSNDSGLMHVAAAVGTPLVALYGSSSPEYTPPLSDEARILSLNLQCSPCFKRVCPLGHTRCLVDLSPTAVETAIDELGALKDLTQKPS